MDKKPKKQIHRPEFLYLDQGSISPKEQPQYPGRGNVNLESIRQEAGSQLPKKEEDLGVAEGISFENYNDIIVTMLDRLPMIRGFFGVQEMPRPIDTASIKNSSVYRESDGTYADIIAKAENNGILKDQLDKSFNVEAAQRYAILQLWVKAEDAHGNNILIRHSNMNEMIPLPINYSRCLGENPNDKKMIVRTTRWETWPALKMPIESNVFNFVMAINGHVLAEELQKLFMKQHGNSLNSEQKAIVDEKFNHLKANILMIQESVKRGLNIRQIFTLVLPHIDKKNFHFVTGGVLEGGELWPARERFVSLPTSFLNSWNKAHQGGGFSTETFQNEICKEIERIKNIPPNVLEERYFAEICFELRRALFL